MFTSPERSDAGCSEAALSPTPFLPALPSTPAPRFVPEMAPDGPAGEPPWGRVHEAEDLGGVEDPNVSRGGEMLPDTHRPVGPEDGQPFQMLAVQMEGVVGDPHPLPFPLGKSVEDAPYHHERGPQPPNIARSMSVQPRAVTWYSHGMTPATPCQPDHQRQRPTGLMRRLWAF